MRRAGKLAAQVLEYAGSIAHAGVVTDAIDKAVHNFIIDHGAYPSPLNYKGFPKSVCTSVNECICHGIPDSRELEDGDILNIDVTVYLDGYHGDTSRMFYIGKGVCLFLPQAEPAKDMFSVLLWPSYNLLHHTLQVGAYGG